MLTTPEDPWARSPVRARTSAAVRAKPSLPETAHSGRKPPHDAVPAFRRIRATGPLGLSLAAVVCAILVIGGMLVVAPSVLPEILTAGGGVVSTGGSAPVSCPTGASTPAAAFELYAPGPPSPTSAGSYLSVTYELMALTIPSGSTSVTVEVPGVTALFPESNGSSLQLFLPPATLAVRANVWTPGLTHSRSIGPTTSFIDGGLAELTTELLAVMVSDPVGSVHLEVRWSWSLAAPNGTTVFGVWTDPQSAGPYPATFFPEPYVALVNRSAATEVAGSAFQVELSGAASHTAFLLKLENAFTGATLNEAWFNSSSQAGLMFTGSIQLFHAGVPLAAGSYLVHVHDSCDGILYNLPVQVVPATNGAMIAGRSLP
jgi:hypothetical protein